MTVWVSRILPSAYSRDEESNQTVGPAIGGWKLFRPWNWNFHRWISATQKSRKGVDFKVVSTTISDVDVHHYPVELKIIFDIDWLVVLKWLAQLPTSQLVLSNYHDHLVVPSCWPKVWQKHDPGELQLFAPAWVKWKPGYIYIYIERERGSPYINWCSPEYRKTSRKNVVLLPEF